MRALTLTTLSSTLALAFCMNAGAADMTMSKAQYKDAKAQISMQLKTAKAACDGQQGNAKSICMEEAKGQEKIALAELENRYEPSSRHSQQLAMANADATYAVAKQKCGDMTGADKDNCMKDAKAAHTQSMSAPKMLDQTSLNSSNPDGTENMGNSSQPLKGESMGSANSAKAAASDVMNSSDNKAAMQKCNSMTGDAKSKCMTDAMRNGTSGNRNSGSNYNKGGSNTSNPTIPGESSTSGSSSDNNSSGNSSAN